MELHTKYKLFLSFLVVICFISVVAGANTTLDQQPMVTLFSSLVGFNIVCAD